MDAVEFLKQWAKEYPVKTRKSEFLKMFPNAKLLEDGTLAISPCIVDKTLYDAKKCFHKNCLECNREYWFQEVE